MELAQLLCNEQQQAFRRHAFKVCCRKRPTSTWCSPPTCKPGKASVQGRRFEPRMVMQVAGSVILAATGTPPAQGCLCCSAPLGADPQRDARVSSSKTASAPGGSGMVAVTAACAHCPRRPRSVACTQCKAAQSCRGPPGCCISRKSKSSTLRDEASAEATVTARAQARVWCCRGQ